MHQGVLFAIASAALYAALDVTRKLLGKKHGPVVVLLGLSAGSIPVFLIGSWIDGWPTVQSGFVPWVIMATACHLVANLLFLRALQISPLSLTIPYLGFTPVFAGLAGILFLGEVPSGMGILGIAIVTLGAIWINPAPPGGKRIDIIRALTHEPGTLLTLGVALLWGFSTLLDKKAIIHSSEMVYALTVQAIIFVLLLAYSIRSKRHEIKALMKGPGLVILAALIISAAMLTQFLAYRTLFVGYTEAIKRGGILLSVLMGIFFFREEKAAQRLTGSAMIVGGVILIILG